MLGKLLVAAMLVLPESLQAAEIPLCLVPDWGIRQTAIKLEDITAEKAIKEEIPPYTDFRWAYFIDGFLISGEASLGYCSDSMGISAWSKLKKFGLWTDEKEYNAVLNKKGEVISFTQKTDSEEPDSYRHIENFFRFLSIANQYQCSGRPIPYQEYEGVHVNSEGYEPLGAVFDELKGSKVLCERVRVYSDTGKLNFANLEKAMLYMHNGKIMAFEVDVLKWNTTFTVRGYQKELEY